MFNNDPKVVSLVASILPLVALFQVFDATCAVTGGILRAQGKQVSPNLKTLYELIYQIFVQQFLGAMFNLTAYYLLGIPLSIFFAFKLQYGLHGLWIGLTGSLIYSSVLGTWVCLRTDWNAEVEKVRNRLNEEDKGHRVVSEV